MFLHRLAPSIVLCWHLIPQGFPGVLVHAQSVSKRLLPNIPPFGLYFTPFHPYQISPFCLPHLLPLALVTISTLFSPTSLICKSTYYLLTLSPPVPLASFCQLLLVYSIRLKKGPDSNCHLSISLEDAA